MPERMMTHRQLEELKVFMEDMSDALQFRSHASSYFWPLLRTALAPHVRVAAFKEWAREYLASGKWLHRTLIPTGYGDSCRTCAQCHARLHKGEIHAGHCFIGRLEKLMEGSDADKA